MRRMFQFLCPPSSFRRGFRWVALNFSGHHRQFSPRGHGDGNKLICLVVAGSFVACWLGFAQGLTPPTFIQEPIDRTITVGRSVTFSGNATGSLPIFYQWLFNEAEIPGATNRFYTLPSVHLEDAGHYRLGASNAAGFVLSSNATLTVTQQPPTITGQPTSRRALVGSQMSIGVVAVGSLPLFYQWIFETTELPGATNATLTMIVDSRAQEGGYRVRVSNAFGSVLSTVASLTVVDLEQALDSTGLAWTSTGSPGWLPEINVSHDGSDAAFSGLVSYLAESRLGATVLGPGSVNFWWLNGASTPTPVLWMQVDGVTQLTVGPTLAWQSATVFVEAGMHTLEWVCAGVRPGVTASGWLDEVHYQFGPTPVSLVGTLTNLVVSAGTDPVLNVVARGTPPLRFQWTFNDELLAGATGPVLRLNNVQAAAAGRYELTVANEYGPAVSTSADVLVEPSAPTIVTLPVTQRALLRNSVSFSVEGRGTEPLTYQWVRNGASLPEATNRTLLVHGIGSNDLGRYEVTVRNVLGTASGTAFLLQQFSALVAWGANSQGQTTIPAEVYDLHVFAGGPGYSAATRLDSRLTFWGTFPLGAAPVVFPVAIAAGTRHMLVLTFDGRVIGVNGASIPAGLDGVVAIAAGADLSMALRQNGRLAIWGAGSVEMRDVAAGLSNITAIACGRHHALALKSDSRVVAWGPNFFGGTVVPPNLDGVVGIACGVFHSMALKSDGTVVCWGYNEFGQCTPPAELDRVIAIAGGLEHSMALREDGTVVVWGGNSAGQRNIPATVSNVIAIASGEMHCLALLHDGSPYPTASPLTPARQQSVPAGALVSFGSFWAGSRPLTFQWQRDGVELPGATEATFVLEEATLGDAGAYRCVAQNVFGSWVGPVYQLAVGRTTPRFGVSSFGLQFSEGGLGLEVNGLSGHGPVVLYASTNLLQWEPIYTNATPVLGTVRVVDPDALKLPRRFYRANEL